MRGSGQKDFTTSLQKGILEEGETVVMGGTRGPGGCIFFFHSRPVLVLNGRRGQVGRETSIKKGLVGEFPFSTRICSRWFYVLIANLK